MEVARLQGEFIISTGNWARFNQTTTHNNTKKAVTTKSHNCFIIDLATNLLHRKPAHIPTLL